MCDSCYLAYFSKVCNAGGGGGLDDVFARMQSRTQGNAGRSGEEEDSMLRGGRVDASAPESKMTWGRSWGRR